MEGIAIFNIFRRNVSVPMRCVVVWSDCVSNSILSKETYTINTIMFDHVMLNC